MLNSCINANHQAATSNINPADRLGAPARAVPLTREPAASDVPLTREPATRAVQITREPANRTVPLTGDGTSLAPVYPSNRAGWLQKLLCLIARSASARQLGVDVMLLIHTIAAQEDFQGYKSAPIYFRDELQRLVGIWSQSRLDRACQKAVEMGWLVIVPRAAGDYSVARYWTRLPDFLSIFADEPMVACAVPVGLRIDTAAAFVSGSGVAGSTVTGSTVTGGPLAGSAGVGTAGFGGDVHSIPSVMEAKVKSDDGEVHRIPHVAAPKLASPEPLAAEITPAIRGSVSNLQVEPVRFRGDINRDRDSESPTSSTGHFQKDLPLQRIETKVVQETDILIDRDVTQPS